MNQPDRFERFVVPDHLQKVAYGKDTKVLNAGTLTFQREDHTIGNLMRTKLLEDQDVTFAGYRIPHPLEYRMVVKVQTTGKDRQTGARYGPLDAAQQALTGLAAEYEDISAQLTSECSRHGGGLPPDLAPPGGMMGGQHGMMGGPGMPPPADVYGAPPPFG